MAKSRVRGARPKGNVEQIRQRGGEALALANETRTAIERRLPANTIEQLTADLPSVGGVVPNALSARGEKKAATGSERTTARVIADHVASIRDNIKHAYGSDKAVLKGWGVGAKVNPATTKSVVAAANMIVARAAANHDEVSGAGIVDDDITTLTAQVAALQGADDAQGDKVRASKEATSTRDATLVRIENATQTIGLRGRQEFLRMPDMRRRFEALLAPYGRAKRAAAPADGAPKS
jgi:hypothetical protein